MLSVNGNRRTDAGAAVASEDRSRLANAARRIRAPGSELSFADAETAGHVAVGDETLRELEIELSKDGSRTKLEIEIEWTGAGPAAPEAASAGIDTAAPQSYRGDLLDQAGANDDFRRVIATNTHTQLVLMTIPAGGEIGSDVHTGVDQIPIWHRGQRNVGPRRGRTAVHARRRGGRPARHPAQLREQRPEKLRLVTVYGPPAHRAGTIHHTKADADRDEADVPPQA